jgi:uncharacterized LabA/DUF88 family protein
MEPRACVFVDGENLRHSILKLFEGEFAKEQYLPKTARWASLFDDIVRQAAGGRPPPLKRLRTYWYVVAHLDFWPYEFPADEAALGALLAKDKRSSERLRGLDGDRLKAECRQIACELEADRERMRRRFDGWHRIQDGIQLAHDAIEFRRAGSLTYNLFERRFGTEKAVDVKLATDLVVLREIYDVAVIVSGDQDYVPAVEYVKDCGKTIVNVSFKTHGGRVLPGGARRLNLATDRNLAISYEAAKRFLDIA